MATSVGRIDLDLGINRQGLKREVKSVGKTLGSALSVAVGNIFANLAQSAIKNLGGFFKSSVELGSSIAELENVTSTVFPSMQAQVEEFSTSALQQYGLTEMQTKKMMGTFGAMAQSFKYTEKEAYNMSTALTGLVGDVSSFYNLDHDVAYTKIKAVFTGETESLKELGIVMTQTALDEYALAQGIGKTVDKMSEQEKVALRMSFVTDQLSFAAGDFAKTQNQWANQTRILSGQWDSFKSAIGQGFIAVLTPLIQGLNKLMATVVALGQKFRDFIYMVMGKDIGSGAGALMGEIADVTVGAAEAAETASDSTSSSAKKASKAAKDIKNSVLGFDQLNKLSAPSDSDSSGAGGGGASSMLSSMGASILPDKAETDTVLGSLDTMKKKLEDIANWTGLTSFWDSFKAGIDLIDFSVIKTNFQTILNELIPIAEISLAGLSVALNSSMGFIGTLLGQTVATAGKSIEIASGGIAQFLEAESGNITKWIANTSLNLSTGFDNLAFSAETIFGSFWEALTTNQVEIESAIANMLGAFTNSSMVVGTIFTDMWVGLTEGIKNFVTDNKEELDTFFNGLMEIGTESINLVSDVFNDLFDSLLSWWESDGKRIWDEIVGVFGDLVGWAMRIWNEILAPIINSLIEEVRRLWEESLKPLWDEFLKLVTSVWDALKALWDGIIKPLVDYFIDAWGPYISQAISNVISVFGTLFSFVSDIVKSIIKVIRGIIDFIVGVFTGDWKKAWEGIKTIVGGIFDGIWAGIKCTINLIIDGINSLWSGLYSTLRKIVNGVGGVIQKIGSAIGKDWGFSIPAQAPLIPKLAEGGYVRANQPQLAVIGDNKRHGEIVAPENKLYEIVSAALQAFMGQLIAALSSSTGSQQASETMQLIIQLGEETIVNRIIKKINSESRRQGATVIKV